MLPESFPLTRFPGAANRMTRKRLWAKLQENAVAPGAQPGPIKKP